MIMIPWIVDRYGPRVARFVGWVVTGLFAVITLAALYFSVRNYFTAPIETQMRVNAAQATGQRDSAHDAIQTIGNTADAAQTYDLITRENANAIDNAKGANAVVDINARIAGMHALCRRKAFRDAHAACLQPVAP